MKKYHERCIFWLYVIDAFEAQKKDFEHRRDFAKLTFYTPNEIDSIINKYTYYIQNAKNRYNFNLHCLNLIQKLWPKG